MSTKAKSKKTESQEVKNLPYFQSKISCACGAVYEAGSTREEIRVDICASCHPFFTGEKRFVDTEGRVEKFMKKYKLNDDSAKKSS